MPASTWARRPQQSLTLLRASDRLAGLGYPLLLSASNKTFLGVVLGLEIDERWEASLAATAMGAALGCRIMRVHDVAAHRQVCSAWPPSASARRAPPAGERDEPLSAARTAEGAGPRTVRRRPNLATWSRATTPRWSPRPPTPCRAAGGWGRPVSDGRGVRRARVSTSSTWARSSTPARHPRSWSSAGWWWCATPAS